MEFKDMKVIWDSQNEEPLFAVNQHGLKAAMDKKAREFNHFIFKQEAQSYLSGALVIGMITIALIGYFTGGLQRLKGIEMTAWDAGALFVGILCWAAFVIRVFVSRASKRRSERVVAKNLLEEIEHDIADVDSEIASRSLPALICGYIPPHLGALLFTWVVFRATGLPDWSILPFICVMAAGFILETSCQRRLVPKKLQPRKQELESLRRKLLATQAE